MTVDLMRFARGRDVVIDGERVPHLEAHPQDGGGIQAVFDRRVAVDLDASNYEAVLRFVADVIRGVSDPQTGRRFSRLVELGEPQEDDQ